MPNNPETPSQGPRGKQTHCFCISWGTQAVWNSSDFTWCKFHCWATSYCSPPPWGKLEDSPLIYPFGKTSRTGNNQIMHSDKLFKLFSWCSMTWIELRAFECASSEIMNKKKAEVLNQGLYLWSQKLQGEGIKNTALVPTQNVLLCLQQGLRFNSW